MNHSSDEDEDAIIEDVIVPDVEELNVLANGNLLEEEDDPDTNAIQAVDTLVSEALNESISTERYIQCIHELATFLENLVGVNLFLDPNT
tara:strand:+ start:157 stop:426 length:270 start_codon:yes stop_codon:yes gene_type:complete